MTAASNIPAPDLSEEMRDAATQLSQSLAHVRAIIEHPGIKGRHVEQSVAKFLRDHLPTSLDVSGGSVFDVNGGRSRQLDLVVHDQLHTPKLFIGDDPPGTLLPTRVLPVEGALWVIEVKTRVATSDIASIIENMRSVKTLEKKAYFDRTGFVASIDSVFMYGEEREHFPLLYSLFAFETDSNPNALCNELNTLQAGFAVDQRIDNVCLLDKGVLLNHTGGQHVGGIPTATSELGFLASEHALLLWFILNTHYILQARSEPINLAQYLDPSFVF